MDRLESDVHRICLARGALSFSEADLGLMLKVRETWNPSGLLNPESPADLVGLRGEGRSGENGGGAGSLDLTPTESVRRLDESARARLPPRIHVSTVSHLLS